MKSGILILDKPTDFTSFDAVAVLRKLYHTKKVGHTGTLDPMATGVLPILLGNATRAADLLPETDKAYRADFRLGVTTDTQDATGTVQTESALPVSEAALEAACARFRGDILQIPPMYSALKHNGVPLYDLARKGIEIEREARPIRIETLTVAQYDASARTGTLFVRCSKGTYIRTLIADIGEALGCGGIMTALRRTEACGFSLSEAHTLAELRALSPEALSALIRPTESLFAPFAAVSVTEKQGVRFQNGGALDGGRLPISRHMPEGALLRVKCGGRFLGLGRYDAAENMLKVCKLFPADADEDEPTGK